MRGDQQSSSAEEKDVVIMVDQRLNMSHQCEAFTHKNNNKIEKSMTFWAALTGIFYVRNGKFKYYPTQCWLHLT